MLFGYPAIPVEEFEASRHDFQQLDRLLASSLSMPIICAPEQVIYPRQQFFDTIYHLTKAGKDQYSEMLLACIGQQVDRIARDPDRAARSTSLR